MKLSYIKKWDILTLFSLTWSSSYIDRFWVEVRLTNICTRIAIYSSLLVIKMDVLTSFIFCSCVWQMRDVTCWCLVTVAVNMMILLAEGIHTVRNYFTLRNYTRTSVAYITYIFRIHKIRVHTLHTLCALSALAFTYCRPYRFGRPVPQSEDTTPYRGPGGWIFPGLSPMIPWFHPYSLRLRQILEKVVLRQTLLGVFFFVLISVPFNFHYFVQWPTDAQIIDKLSHCSYIFRHYRVILKELVVSTLPSYTSMSNAAVGTTI